MPRQRWFAIGKEPAPRLRVTLTFLSFLLPLAVWALVSYVPWLWHPLVNVTSPGDIAWFKSGLLVERAVFEEENAKISAAGGHAAECTPANPVFLPAPHKVARAFWTAFTSEPARKGDVWLHESL